jgi:THO complex subunit 4
MSSDKLNQSLDAILSERRKSSTRGRARGSRRAASGARPAPVGGVKKTTKPVKTNERVNANAGPAKSGDSKILVSGLVS